MPTIFIIKIYIKNMEHKRRLKAAEFFCYKICKIGKLHE